jgi:hypothetical protein
MVLEVCRDTNSDVKILEKFRVNRKRKKKSKYSVNFFMSSHRQDCDLKMNLSVSYSIVSANSLKVLELTLLEKDKEIRVFSSVVSEDISQFPCLSNNRNNIKEPNLASKFGG